MLIAVVIILGLLSFVAMQGAIIFLTALLLRKAVVRREKCSKRRAMFLSYCAWVIVTMSSYAILVGDMGLFDGLGGVLFACLTALPSAVFYLWLWQKHDSSLIRTML